MLRYCPDVDSVLCLLAQSGMTPLHIAAYHGNAQMVEFLIDLGCNVGAMTNVSPLTAPSAAMV